MPAGFLEPGGRAAGWSQGGRGIVVEGYGRWLTWLVRTGQLDPASSADARVTRARVAAYAEWLGSRIAPMSVSARIGQLAQAMRALAPEHDWRWLFRAASRIAAVAVPVRAKRQRMQECQVLVELGIQLMRRAGTSNPRLNVRQALLYRDGLMIALMAYRPLRLRTFAAITLGQHLVQRNEIWWLAFSAEDTKTKEPMEMSFPKELVPYLEVYLHQHRPVILKRNSRREQLGTPAPSALWIATGGKKMASGTINAQIGKHTLAAFGKPINPHLFRDCAATPIAIQDPKHVRMIAPILGHRSPLTSERHYNQARTLEAARRYQQTIRQALGQAI